jgi:hypothetical protein
MKKILSFFLMLFLLSTAATAQREFRQFRARPSEITRFERLQLQRDVFRHRIAERGAKRDGIVTPFERRKLYKMKERTRRDAFRFRHNGRNRVI